MTFAMLADEALPTCFRCRCALSPRLILLDHPHIFFALLTVAGAVEQFALTRFASAHQLDVASHSVLDPVSPHRALRVVCVDDLGELYLDEIPHQLDHRRILPNEFLVFGLYKDLKRPLARTPEVA